MFLLSTSMEICFCLHAYKHIESIEFVHFFWIWADRRTTWHQVLGLFLIFSMAWSVIALLIVASITHPGRRSLTMTNGCTHLGKKTILSLMAVPSRILYAVSSAVVENISGLKIPLENFTALVVLMGPVIAKQYKILIYQTWWMIDPLILFTKHNNKK